VIFSPWNLFALLWTFAKRTLTVAVLSSLLTSCGSNEQISPASPLTLLSTLELGSLRRSDVWGYVDPISNKEYALIGGRSQFIGVIGNVMIVDVTDPVNPQFTSEVQDIFASDMKVWGNYMYVTSDGVFQVLLDNPSGIVDLSDITNPVIVGSFESAHNIFIDNKGYLYLAGTDSGTKIYNLNIDPENPVLVWDDPSFGASHDVAIIRNKLYDFHWDEGTLIYDVSNPENPALLGTVRYQGFNHSGWVTDDDQYLFIADETVYNTQVPVEVVKFVSDYRNIMA